jgi:hypothetical protein
MATRAQIIRLEQRIDALIATRSKRHIIVVDPSETNEQAIQRARLSAAEASRRWFRLMMMAAQFSSGGTVGKPRKRHWIVTIGSAPRSAVRIKSLSFNGRGFPRR